MLRGAADLWISDEPAPADAIAVSAAGSISAVCRGRLLSPWLAPKILISNIGATRAEELGVLQSHVRANSEVLQKLGVPAAAIEPFGDHLSDTFAEATALHEWAVRNGAHRIIVPTDIFATRRLRWTLHHVFGNDAAIRCRQTRRSICATMVEERARRHWLPERSHEIPLLPAQILNRRMSDVAVRVNDLGKKYRIRHQRRERYVALRDVITDGFRNVLRGKASGAAPATEDFWALKDVSFEVKRGEVVGIIGRNGAGKSTLLKVISRITEPNEGRIELTGRVASMLEVGTGFHPELTGRENIYLNGAILGMRRAEIKRRFDEIVAFADVENFLDTPVKRFSSGMCGSHAVARIWKRNFDRRRGVCRRRRRVPKCLGKMSRSRKAPRCCSSSQYNRSAPDPPRHPVGPWQSRDGCRGRNRNRQLSLVGG